MAPTTPTIPPDAGTVDFNSLSPEQQEAALASGSDAIRVRSTGQVYRVENMPPLPNVPAVGIPPLDAPQVAPQAAPGGAAVDPRLAMVQDAQRRADATLQRVRDVASDPLAIGDIIKSGVTGYQDIALQKQKAAFEPATAKGNERVAGKAKPMNPQELAELQALEQQFSGAPGAAPDLGPPQPLTLRLGSSERTSAALGPKAAAAARGAVANARLRAGGAIGAMNAALSAEQKVQNDLAAQFEPLVKQYGERAPQLLQMHDRMQQSLEQSRQRIEQMQIDPQRLLREMPTSNSVMMGIAAMLGGFTGNKQPMELLQRAIDRDIAGQRANIQKAIQSHNLTQAQANSLWNQYTHFEQARRQAMGDVAKFKLGAAAVQSKKAAAMLDYANMVKDIDKWGVEVEKAATPRVTSRSTTAINPVAVAQQKAMMAASMAASAPPKINRVIEKEVRQEATDLDTGIQSIELLKRKVAQMGENPLFWKGWSNAKATQLMREFDLLALGVRRGQGDSGPVIKHDFKVYGVPGTAGEFGRFLTRTNLLQRLEDDRQKMLRRKHTMLRNKLGPMGGIIGRTLQQVSENPAPPEGFTPSGGRAQ